MRHTIGRSLRSNVARFVSPHRSPSCTLPCTPGRYPSRKSASESLVRLAGTLGLRNLSQVHIRREPSLAHSDAAYDRMPMSVRRTSFRKSASVPVVHFSSLARTRHPYHKSSSFPVVHFTSHARTWNQSRQPASSPVMHLVLHARTRRLSRKYALACGNSVPSLDRATHSA